MILIDSKWCSKWCMLEKVVFAAGLESDRRHVDQGARRQDVD
jgi:hypothetical protein